MTYVHVTLTPWGPSNLNKARANDLTFEKLLGHYRLHGVEESSILKTKRQQQQVLYRESYNALFKKKNLNAASKEIVLGHVNLLLHLSTYYNFDFRLRYWLLETGNQS